jgi:hypothetical protein
MASEGEDGAGGVRILPLPARRFKGAGVLVQLALATFIGKVNSQKLSCVPTMHRKAVSEQKKAPIAAHPDGVRCRQNERAQPAKPNRFQPA